MGSDCKGIEQLKIFLQKKFYTKDLGTLRYFLGLKWPEHILTFGLLKKLCLRPIRGDKIIRCKAY